MKSYFQTLYANENNKMQLAHLIENKLLSHAYIIEGPKGSGKFTFAKLISCAALCSNQHSDHAPCLTCPTCLKILNETTPDFHIIESDKTIISIDAIRELKEDVYLSSSEMDLKIYVIKQAEKMTPQAQNALLKVLEEPPTAVLIFLLTESSNLLLTTIRSRAQLLRMELLSKTDLENGIKEIPFAQKLKHESPEQYSMLLESCEGNLGKLQSLLNDHSREEIQEQRNQVLSLIKAIIWDNSYNSILKEKKDFPQKRQDAILFLQNLSLAIRDLLLLQTSEEVTLHFYINREQAENDASRCGIKKLNYMFDQVKKSLDALNSNCSLTIVYTSLLTNLYLYR